MLKKIKPINTSCYAISFAIDYEYKAIMLKLLQYGIKPTGNKNVDKNILHEKELDEAKTKNDLSSNFLTVSKLEQEKIQTQKKEKKEEANPLVHPNSLKGQKILGEQIMLAIQMKKEEEEILRKKLKEEQVKEKQILEKNHEEKRIEEHSKISENNDIEDSKKIAQNNPFNGQNLSL